MRFDIATPSYNQAYYLRETIDSVLSQNSPSLEVFYYIMDGGSTDESADIIRSYASKLAYWRSIKDQGQAAAIKEALEMGCGDIVAWINSDDFYPPDTFQKIAEYFTIHPNVDIVYGDCLMVNEKTTPVGMGAHIALTWEDLFETPYLINQEATFFRRRIYEEVGGLDPAFWGAMDYDLWLRLFYKGKAAYIPEVIGSHRFVQNQKTSVSDRYINEMKLARQKFAQRFSKKIPPWPFSRNGWIRIKQKWEQHWRPILQWITQGALENDFSPEVESFWQTYSQYGILTVRGGTSFGWVGPNALYVLDRDQVGGAVHWVWMNSLRGIGAKRLRIEIEGDSFTVELKGFKKQKLKLNPQKRFSVVKISADKSFIPANEGMGPAYFSLSHTSHPVLKGRKLLSIQTIPNFPDWHGLNGQVST